MQVLLIRRDQNINSFNKLSETLERQQLRSFTLQVLIFTAYYKLLINLKLG